MINRSHFDLRLKTQAIRLSGLLKSVWAIAGGLTVKTGAVIDGLLNNVWAIGEGFCVVRPLTASLTVCTGGGTTGGGGVTVVCAGGAVGAGGKVFAGTLGTGVAGCNNWEVVPL